MWVMIFAQTSDMPTLLAVMVDEERTHHFLAINVLTRQAIAVVET